MLLAPNPSARCVFYNRVERHWTARRDSESLALLQACGLGQNGLGKQTTQPGGMLTYNFKTTRCTCVRPCARADLIFAVSFQCLPGDIHSALGETRSSLIACCKRPLDLQRVVVQTSWREGTK